jgi:hypothetical protein
VSECLLCGELIVGPEAIRIQQGGIRYKKWGAIFTSRYSFEDGSMAKYVCKKSAANATLFVKTLTFDTCALCNQTFEPVDEQASDCVLLVERGIFKPNSKSGFEVYDSGHVHFGCACDDWRLPLWSLDRQDVPA